MLTHRLGQPTRGVHSIPRWRLSTPQYIPFRLHRQSTQRRHRIRDGKIVPVSEWHASTLAGLGFEQADDVHVPTPGLRRGANWQKRVEYEHVYLFILNAKP